MILRASRFSAGFFWPFKNHKISQSAIVYPDLHNIQGLGEESDHKWKDQSEVLPMSKYSIRKQS